MSDTRDVRLDRLEGDIRGIKAVLGRLEPLVIRIDERLNTELPALRREMATRVELAEKPGKVFLAGAVGVLLVAYAAGLAGLAALPILAKLIQ
jgi:hypothetical protein